MASLSIFKCISCSQEYDITEKRYRCSCGDLLEVIHDLKSSISNPMKWKKKLTNDIKKIAFHRYKDILFPSLSDKKIISLQEGDTPLYDVSSEFPEFKSISN